VPAGDGIARQRLIAAGALPVRFVLVGGTTTVSANATFTSDRSYCNWNERDAVFQICTLKGCDAPDLDFSAFLKSERGLKRWVWAVLYGSPALILLAALALLFSGSSQAPEGERVKAE
jgi:hypothetical protein